MKSQTYIVRIVTEVRVRDYKRGGSRYEMQVNWVLVSDGGYHRVFKLLRQAKAQIALAEVV